MFKFGSHFNNNFIIWFSNIFCGRFNNIKYFKRRAIVTDPKNKTPIIIKYYYLYWLKRQDLKNHCTFGAGINIGNKFATPPFLPHGPFGIIVGNDAELGEGVILYPMVTIPAGNGGVKIGSHSESGTKSTVLPGIQIGKYCHVGANAVANKDLPDYATIVMSKPRIILHSKPED